MILKPKVPQDRVLEVLQGATDLKGECPDHLDCPVCFQLIVEPQECGSCRSLFCGPCIAKNRKYSSLCPNCKRHIDCRPISHVLKHLITATLLSGCP